jgi:S1-C subfamily serine protease
MADSSSLLERIKRHFEQRTGLAAALGPSTVDAFVQEIRRKQTLIQALDDFIRNIYVADGLRTQDAQRSVAESLVELTYYGQHSSNGLLITDDGYFFTALHCIENDGHHPLDQARVRLYDGTIYPVEKVCARLKSEDLAIVKAAIPTPCRARQYRFYNTNVLDNDAVVLLSRWNGTLVAKDGSITHANYVITVRNTNHPDIVYYNHFLTDHASIHGDSGGTITTPDGRVAGLVSGGNYMITSGVKLIRLLDLLHGYKRHIQRSLE